MMAATPTAEPKDKQWSVIWFLTLKNVSDSEIHMRMCVVYGAETLFFRLVSEFSPGTPQKRSDTLDTPVSSYKDKQQDQNWQS